MPLVTMFATNRCSLTNTRKVFECDCLARYGGFGNQRLADAVVHILLESVLFARRFTQPAFGTLGANHLKSLTTKVVASTHGMNNRTAKRLTLTVGGKVHNAKVNAERAICLVFGRCLAALRHVQGVHALSPHHIGTANFPCRIYQHLVLARAKQQATDDTAFQRVERHLVKTHQPIGARVVAYATAITESGTGLLLLGARCLGSFNRFGSSADRKLCAQSEAQSCFAVHAVMRRVGIGDSLVSTHSRNPRRSSIEGALGRGQHRVMAVNVQLTADGARE